MCHSFIFFVLFYSINCDKTNIDFLIGNVDTFILCRRGGPLLHFSPTTSVDEINNRLAEERCQVKMASEPAVIEPSKIELDCLSK